MGRTYSYRTEKRGMTWPHVLKQNPVPRDWLLPRYLLDLLALQLDRLIIHKNTLSLVRFRHPPLANIGGKLHDHLLLHALQQDPCWLGCRSLHSAWHSKLDRVRIAHFEVYELLI